MPWLINSSQLEKFRKNQKHVIVLDATWYLPNESGNAYQEFLNRRINGARFLDLSQFIDKETNLPNMLTRDEAKVSSLISELGITNDHKIIFYDNSKQHTSCHALWIFKMFGHNPNQLYILDVGLAGWERLGGKVESGESKPATQKPYTATYQPQYLRTLQQMKSNVQHPKEQVMDVRHPVRFAGGRESKPGLRFGHIPGSYSFPFTTMFEADGRWKSVDKIRKQLISVGVDLSHPIITTCGSGTTAPILNFALDVIGNVEHSLYDGSWSEWGAEQLYPGETSVDERPVVKSVDM